MVMSWKKSQRYIQNSLQKLCYIFMKYIKKMGIENTIKSFSFLLKKETYKTHIL